MNWTNMGYPIIKDKSQLTKGDIIMLEGIKEGQFLIQAVEELTEDGLILLENGLDACIQGLVCVLGRKGDSISFIF